MDYAACTTEIQKLLATDNNDVDLTEVMPGGIDYAEQRMYRELNLLSTVTRNSTGALAPGNRNFTYPAHFVVTEQINLITPAGNQPDAGTRNPLRPTSKEFLDFAWPSATGAGLPSKFAMLTDQSILVGPWPDAAYVVEIVGTTRPAPLSPTNTTTFLTLYLPDAFIAALMVFFSGYRQNFGAQADDPRMSSSWETQYQSLVGSANAEELRKKFGSSAVEATPNAQP